MTQAIRLDFDYTCECGYYECSTCGAPYYPMEASDCEYECRVCGMGDLLEV